MNKTRFTNSARYICLENLEKNAVDLALCYCGIEDCDPDHYYGPAARKEYLLHYIIDGKGIYQTGKKTYYLKKNQAFLICPGDITYYIADHDDPWKYLWVAFNGIKANTYLKWARLDKENPICFFEDADLLIGYVKGMLDARELTYSNELMRQGYLLLFLSALTRSQYESNPSKNAYDHPYQIYLNHALEFIEHNYMRGIKVSDIVKYIGISRSYLTSIFKKALNMSVQEYLVNYRLDRAATLLRTTDASIGKIASEVGYEDSLTFSKIFKSVKGYSPTNFRTETTKIENSSTRLENNKL